MPKYSLITPCFNSWKYMRSYLKSLEEQTCKDFEVIIIDDCSKDNTFKNLTEYQKKSHLLFHIIRNDKNYGPGYSRNRGMECAKGEWILFADSDDSLEPELFEKINRIIAGNSRAAVPINCVIFDYRIIKGRKSMINSSVYGDYVSGILSLSESISNVRNHVIGKVYKAEMLKAKKIVFPELKRCEDVAFVCRAIEACSVSSDKQIGLIYYMKEPLYHYFYHTDSLSNDFHLDETDMIQAYEIIEKYMGTKYTAEICIKSVPDLLYGVVLIMCKAGKSNGEIKRYIERYEKKFPGWYHSCIVPRLGKAKYVYLKMIKQRNINMLKILSKIHTKLIGG